MRGGGGKGHLEFFQKFIRFGSGILPLGMGHATILDIAEKLQYNFLKMGGRGCEGCLKFSRKFIQFGSVFQEALPF